VVICSDEILAEVTAVLMEFKMSESQIAGWMEFISRNSVMARPISKVDICSDKDDNKFLEAAETGKAEYIITGDKHLRSLKEHRSAKIITPQEFIKKH
jgi:putative PIN family toxin of toxin-antitoxin system